MSERTLTEELQSVLRAHSLDAPEPTNSIAAILDQTVQSDRAVAGPTRWAAAARARLRAVPSSAVAAAAVVAAIVVLAVGVRSLGSSDSAPKSSSAGVSVAAGSASAGVDGPENAGPPSPVYGGEKSAAAGSARGGVFAPGLATVLCAKGETGVSTLVGTLPPPATGTASAASATPAQPLSVVQLDCMAADGKTLGSDLSVYRTGTGTTTRIAQLIRPAQGLAIGSVSVALPT
ncbi:MAG: hypothetical protein JWO63_1921, partial [Frankiales bacterium]|nr:hypothetical protein [Frankiales bacterium]